MRVFPAKNFAFYQMKMKENSSRFAKTRSAGAALIALMLIFVLGIVSATMIQGLYLNRQHLQQSQLRVQSKILFRDFQQRTREFCEKDPAFSGEELRLEQVADTFPGTFLLISRRISENDEPLMEFELQYINEQGKVVLEL